MRKIRKSTVAEIEFLHFGSVQKSLILTYFRGLLRLEEAIFHKKCLEIPSLGPQKQLKMT